MPRARETGIGGQAAINLAGQIALNAISGALQPGNFIDNEVPAGTINGANTVFTLANTPFTGTLKVYRDGARTTAYVLATATITFSVAPASSVLCDYRI